MKFILLLLFIIPISVQAIEVGALRSDLYLNLLKGKNVTLVVNQTSRVNDVHLIDFLLNKKVKLKKLFALEHGIRGNLDAGEDVANGVDVKTGLPVISLYGKNKRPSEKDLQNVDTIIFDIQDVGVRFYTYISSLYYILESCGQYQKECIVFDRPNPLADLVAGPVLERSQQSFLGMYLIPVVHGLTVGELATMAVAEKWIVPSPKLKVIPVKGWKRTEKYDLPIKPSPNLPNAQSIELYASLALFEPTQISIGRGTYMPFQVIGFPDPQMGSFTFTPKSIVGMSKYPKHENSKCYGVDLRKVKAFPFTLKYLVEYYQKYSKKDFFKHRNFFNKLIGNDWVIKKVESGIGHEQIESLWKKDLLKYKQLRSKYLIYE